MDFEIKPLTIVPPGSLLATSFPQLEFFTFAHFKLHMCTHFWDFLIIFFSQLSTFASAILFLAYLLDLT